MFCTSLHIPDVRVATQTECEERSTTYKNTSEAGWRSVQICVCVCVSSESSSYFFVKLLDVTNRDNSEGAFAVH